MGQVNFCIAQTKIYPIDASKSSIAFELTHLGVLKVNGQFRDFSGIFVFDDEKLIQVESKIEVKSIDTEDKSRDQSLVDEGYLNAKEYPFIHFKSVTVENNLITGMLNIKGVEKNIETPFHLIKNKELFELTISTEISRMDFNLDFGAMDALIGDRIQIELKIVTLLD